MLKHSDIIEKLNTLQKAEIISSALDAAPFEQAGIPAVRSALLRELGKAEGVSYECAVRSWNPALVGAMTEELVLEAAEKGDKLFLTPDLKAAINPYEEGLSEDAFLNGAVGADIIRAVRGTGAAAGLARPSLGMKEIEYLDRREDPAAIHDLVVKPFLQAVKDNPCDAVFMAPSREGTGYYNTNRALFSEVQSGLLGDNVFIVGEGVNSSADSVSLLNGRISLGGVIIPLERAARRYVQLRQYEAEGSVARRELEDSLRDGTAIDEEKIDLILDEIIDFAITLDGLTVQKEFRAEGFGASPADIPEANATGTEGPAQTSSEEDNIKAETGTEESADAVREGPEQAPSEEPAVPPFAEARGEEEYGFSIPAGVPSDKRARYRTAAESIVLLKNSRLLPLEAGTKIAVLGEAYNDLSVLGEKFNIVGKAPGYARAEVRSEALIPTAVRATNRAQAVVVFLWPDATGRELALPPNRIALLDALKKAKKRVIAVICGDMPVDMTFDSYADAVLAAPGNGDFAGEALARVLCGEINPSGKLSRTFYDRADAYFKNFRHDRDAGRMNVGAFIGYRRYELEGKKIRYPFGFGLSYTEFRYSGLDIDENAVSFTLTNCGKTDGSEVAQVYLGVPSASRVTPKKQLRAFKKVFLRAGESKRITVPFPAESYETFDSNLYADNVETGEYIIYVGASSLDIRLRGKRGMEGVIRESLDESNEDYFPDSEYKDEESVKKENRIRRTADKTPEKLRQLHTAAMFAVPLIGMTFFLLISVLILSYTLNYFILSVAAEDTMEWALYIFAIAMLALCPLLGNFNRKRLVRARMAALVATPILIAVCFVLGALMLSANGGIVERIALRIITCFAVGTPIFAVVATIIERQLWKTRSGANRWDRFYFTREQDEKTTSDKEFETAFKAVEARAKKKEEVKEEPLPVVEFVRFYDKSLTYEQLINDCKLFAAERGLNVAENVLRNWIAAVFSTQLIIVPSGDGPELCETVSEYFGKKAYIDNAAGYRRYEDLFTQWRQSGNANFPTNLAAATESAKRESAYLHTVLIRHVDRSVLETLFLPVAEVIAHRRSNLPPVGGKNFDLPPNLLIVAEAEGEGLTGLPASIAEIASALSPTAEKCEPVLYKTVLQAVGYERLSAMRQNVRDSYTIDEDLWKKVDLLNERSKAAHIGNYMWKKLETHSSVVTACGGEGYEALDGALSAELLPWLSSVWNEKICGSELSKVLPEIFGNTDLSLCTAFAGSGEDKK